MLEVETAELLLPHVGQVLGVSNWLTIDQAMIDAFAEVTGDRQWIHVDVERARRELPGGSTIAHGFLTLSLLPRLSAETWAVRKRARAINYGADRLRFVHVVASGSRIRLHATLRSVTEAAGGHRIAVEATIEIDGEARPALVAETITLLIQ